MRQAILGKDDVIEQLLVCLAAGGHLLIEDLPGVGKTTLAYALARSTDCAFSRIQFTSDLLPSDVTGVAIYDETTRDFVFKPGPVFANIVLADEINRAPPKTQSALLEVMDRARVTVDGGVPLGGLPVHGLFATPEPRRLRGDVPAPREPDGPLPDAPEDGLPAARRTRSKILRDLSGAATTRSRSTPKSASRADVADIQSPRAPGLRRGQPVLDLHLRGSSAATRTEVESSGPARQRDARRHQRCARPPRPARS